MEYTKNSKYEIGGKLNNYTNINMKFNIEKIKKFKKGGKSSKEIKEKASRKERKYQKRSDAFNSALQNIENLRASGASASEIGVAQGNLGRLQNRLGADGLNRLREEQRTQAIARDVANTQARETVQAARGSFGSYQSPQVNVAIPTRTAQIAPVPQITPQTNLVNHFRTRGEAFNYAINQGWKTFTYDDGKGKYKQFTTEVAVPDSGTAKQQGQQTQVQQTQAQPTQPPVENIQPTKWIPPESSAVNNISTISMKAPKDPSIISTDDINTTTTAIKPVSFGPMFLHNKRVQTPVSFWYQPRYGWGNLWDPSANYYEQGGTIEKLQTGGWLSKILSRLFTTAPNPNEHRVNENTTTVYEEGTPFIGRPFEKRGITSNGQTSSMYIKNPNTSKADTTFYSPGYSKDPELYPEFTPQDIRSGNKKGRGKESFMRKFQSPEYFPHLKYQQGGVIGSNEEEVVMDFVSRFSQMTGIDPNTDQGQQVLSPVVNLFVEGGYIQQYGSMDDNGRDQMVQDIVYQMQEGQNQTVEYAKKGAKLKLLRQYK